MAEGSIPHFVYWVYDETCICPRLHGYVGITKNLTARIKSHRKRFGTSKYAVLLIGSRLECRRHEYSLRPIDNVGWNRAPGGQRPPKWTQEAIEKVRASKMGKPRSEEVKQKLRLANLGKKMPEEQKQQLKLRMMGNTLSHHSEEVRQKIRKAQLGRIHTAEARANMGRSHLGSKRSEETRQKMRLAQLGRFHSEETKQKLKEAALRQRENRSKRMIGNNFGHLAKGKKRSAETRAKMSASAKLRKASPETRAKLRALMMGNKRQSSKRLKSSNNGELACPSGSPELPS